MRNNTLLAGVAALALLAGTGLVAAQDTTKDQGGATPNAAGTSPQDQGKPAQDAQNNGLSTDQNAKGAKGAGTVQQSARQNGQTANHSAQNFNHAQHSDRLQTRTAQREEHRGHVAAQQQPSKHGNAAAAEQRQGNAKTAQKMERNGSLKGLQGNTSVPMRDAGAQPGNQGEVGTNVQLTDQQRTTIRNSVIDARGAPRAGHVDFSMQVGTVIPRREIHVVPVPDALVRIDPQWRGFRYFVFQDEVVIVSPRDMKIVAVLPV